MLKFVPHKGKGEKQILKIEIVIRITFKIVAAFREGICTRSLHGCPLVCSYSFNEFLENQLQIKAV